MSKRAIVVLKILLHILCLAPLASLLHFYTSGALALNADPVNYITHFTGDWAIWTLLGSLAITPLRRLSPKISFLIRFRRLIGLYAFFYASLHLATYVFLFSGYDVPSAFAAIKAGHPGQLITLWKAVWPTMWDDLRKRRFIQVGFFAWVILLALACTSPAFIMRAMGGKNWQRLHRLVNQSVFVRPEHPFAQPYDITFAVVDGQRMQAHRRQRRAKCFPRSIDCL